VEQNEEQSVKDNEDVCGWTKGHARHKETWWWNDEVKNMIDIKRIKFKEWHNSKESPDEERKKEDYTKAKKMQRKL